MSSSSQSISSGSGSGSIQVSVLPIEKKRKLFLGTNADQADSIFVASSPSLASLPSFPLSFLTSPVMKKIVQDEEDMEMENVHKTLLALKTDTTSLLSMESWGPRQDQLQEENISTDHNNNNYNYNNNNNCSTSINNSYGNTNIYSCSSYGNSSSRYNNNQINAVYTSGNCYSNTRSSSSGSNSGSSSDRPSSIPPTQPEPEPDEEEGREWACGAWSADEDAKLQEALRKVLGDVHRDTSGIDLDAHRRQGGQRRRINWQLVSEFMGGTRSPKQCYGRYWNTGMGRESKARGGEEKASRRVGLWTAEEDRCLLAEVKRQQEATATAAATTAIPVAASVSLSPEKIALVRKSSSISWSLVSEVLGGQRTRKQCMVHYNSVLRFASSTAKVTGTWMVSEDRLLVEGVRLFRGKGRKGGVAWAKVSEHMGHTRTMKQCKKRWDDAFEAPHLSLL